MALIAKNSFTFNGIVFQPYFCEEAGDGIPLHSHTFNHLTLAITGDIECFSDNGASIKLSPGDDPVEYIAGRFHGIRALSPGALFMNVSPASP